MVLSKRRLAWAAFSVALVLLLIIGGMSYQTTKRLVESERLIAHTHEVQTVMEDLRSDLIEAGYARRGFLISGEESFVAAYRAAVDDIPLKINRLKQVTSDNAVQQHRLVELQELATADLGLLGNSIQLRKGGREDLAEQRSLTQQSAALEARASAIVRGMREEEGRLLGERQAASDRIYRKARYVLVIGFFFALLLLATEFYLFDRELTQHQRTERAARQSRELLNAFFSSSTVGFAILDSELCYRRANAVLANMAGIPQNVFVGNRIAEIFGESGPAAEATLRKVISSGEPILDREVSAMMPGKPGEKQRRHWLVNYFPLREDTGQVTQIGIIALDVTARRRAEEAIRRLSGRLIRLQDEERRRIARELHDSLGQYLAGLKLTIDLLATASEEKRPSLAAEASKLAQECIAETRTVSHLLHPPLLDEVGLSSAASWFVTGFAQRSGLRVSLEIPAELPRMSNAVEITLFRILQESLTNVHRHSRSESADIRLHVGNGDVRLAIRDYGKGIPPLRLEQFQKDGSQAGVGLAGMRERVHELEGSFQIDSGAEGTTVTVVIPLQAAAEETFPMQAEGKSGAA